MKPAVQVPLAILLVAALVYIMYSQSQKKPEEEKSASDPVENVEADTEAENEDEEASSEDVAAYDAITDDVADDDPEEEHAEQPKQASKDQADKDKAKRASASLRERRRNMFKKIDSGQKDGLASKEEHDRFFRKAFNFYDKNDDGRLTGKELSQVKRLPPKADVNKDGVLTRQEFLDQFDRFFDIMDKDKSGDLTQKEFVR